MSANRESNFDRAARVIAEYNEAFMAANGMISPYKWEYERGWIRATGGYTTKVRVGEMEAWIVNLRRRATQTQGT